MNGDWAGGDMPTAPICSQGEQAAPAENNAHLVLSHCSLSSCPARKRSTGKEGLSQQQHEDKGRAQNLKDSLVFLALPSLRSAAFRFCCTALAATMSAKFCTQQHIFKQSSLRPEGLCQISFSSLHTSRQQASGRMCATETKKRHDVQARARQAGQCA